MKDREITVTVPDDDEAETMVRRIATQLYDGKGLIVLTRPPEIQPESMPAIINQVVIYLKAQAAMAPMVSR
jgi:hypothetical protein